MFPEVFSPSQQELKPWHYKLSHLHTESMFRLEKLRVLPSIFIDLKDYVPLCVSCMFGTSRIRQYITKGDKPGSIRKKNYNKPGDAVSVDQLQSGQLGLVPQLSGKLTSVRIWAAQVMVDQFSYLTYVHLMISTTHE